MGLLEKLLDLPEDLQRKIVSEVLLERLEEAQAKLDKIDSWIKAYPLEAFPEPDFKKAARILKDNGMTLDAISASNMRHVLNGISDIIKK